MQFGDPKLPARFWSKVSIAESGCWMWHGEISGKRSKYGRFMVKARTKTSRDVRVMAHRATFAAANGAIPEGLVIDHLCRNHFCVNPSHLEAVTNEENIRRGIWTSDIITRPNVVAARDAYFASRTHCKNGHEYNDENTGVENGRRRCLICRRDYDRRRRPPKCDGHAPSLA